MTKDWTKEWERRVVNGVYPLSRYLARSDHSVVFLTECKAQNIPQAAIKILPAHPALMEAQLGYWKRVATLSHPHLLRLLDGGRCQLGGQDFLFVVMEYAEQNLAQVLSGRPLTPAEVRELLPPTLDALEYLHRKNLVQGSLKPPNFLVVDDQLRLASDTIRPAGKRPASTAKPSSYDAPEAKNGRISTAGDVWALGTTLAEALTQATPRSSRETSESVSLPASLAPELVDAIRRCLDRDPGGRPAASELAGQFRPTPPKTPPPSAPPAINESVVPTPSTQRSPKTRLLVTAILGFVGLCVVWLLVHLFHTHASATQSAPINAPAPPAVSPGADSRPGAGSLLGAGSPRSAGSPPAAVEKPRPSLAAAPDPAVLHQEIPDVSRRALETIRGTVTVTVRVNVDRAGNVVAASEDNRSTSRYFARAAMEAAKKWKFVQAADEVSRVWRLDFAFTPAGATAHAAVPQ